MPFWNPSRIGSVCPVVVVAPRGPGSRSKGVRNVWRAVAQHIFLSMSLLLRHLRVLLAFRARRPWRYSFQCGLARSQQRRCRDFAMWTVNGCPFGCQVCPLLLIHDVPVAPFFCRLCVAASVGWRSRLRSFWFVSSLCHLRPCQGATSRSARAADSDG